AARGERVRIVTVDPVGSLPSTWRADVEAYSGLAGMLDEVEVEFGRESQGIEVSRGDRLIATTWWTAHIAAAALLSTELLRDYFRLRGLGVYAAGEAAGDAASAAFDNAITAIDPPGAAEL